ncbi:MAG: thioredoxin domain-containing protein, partial [Bacteroidota bacterium]|nr:thioredoxin domain-containing protein [Bacteroidota bacterium]
DKAIQNGEFILKNLLKEGDRLDRNYKNGKSTINAFLDDYANVIQAFIGLYQCTFDQQWLTHADNLAKHVLTHFDGDASLMFYFTSDLDAPLVARRLEISDNVIPSANSTMARNLMVLGEILYNTTYTQRAHDMLNKIWPLVLKDGQPSFYSNWCQLMLSMVKPPYEVAIVGKDFQISLAEMQLTYRPDAIYLGGAEEGNLPLLDSKLSDGQTLIYICQNKVCKFPTEDVTKAVSLMKD